MAPGAPSAQVQIPVGDLISSPPPPTYAHTILLGGKFIRERQRTVRGGKVIRRWRKNYKGASADGRRRKNYAAAEKLSRVGAGGPKIRNFFFEKISQWRKLSAQFRKSSIPYLNTMRGHSISLYITKNTILLHCRSYTLS